MSIPDYQSLFVPVLRLTADGKDHSMAEMREQIGTDLKLTPGQLNERLPSGVQTVFANRIGWSTSYLTKAGALRRVKRGVFRITDRGRELLSLRTAKLNLQHLSKYPEFVAFYKRARNGATDDEKPDEIQTPEEQLANAYRAARDSLAHELLETVKKASPAFFEELVVELLVAMGYGGSIEDAGKAIGQPGDAGIDGIIKEDKLGLDVVYVQAKRWSGCVGRPVVQAFAGSLEGARARKGVLITTSTFSQDAIDYVQKIEKRIVLVNGEQLADLMIDHDIGVTVVQTYKIKRLDSDYFETA